MSSSISGGRPPLAKSPSRWILLFSLTVIAAALRFHLLGAKSLWLVEAFSVMVARLPFKSFLHTMWWGEANMTLYYLFLRLWIHFGDSELWLRSLSLLFGLAAVPSIFFMGSRFLNRKAGVIAAILLTIHAFHIQHSQELRSYSLLMLLAILSSCAFLIILENPQRWFPWILYAFLISLAVYAHMFAVFLIAGQWAWLLVVPSQLKRLDIAKIFLTFALIAVLTLPITAVVVLEHKDQLEWVPPLSAGIVFELFQDLAGAGTAVIHGSVRALSLLALYAAAWIVALCAMFRDSRNRADDSASAALPFLVSWFVFPIAAILGISTVKPIQAPRYVLMCVPASILLAAWGLVNMERLGSRWRRSYYVVLSAMVVFALWSTFAFYATFKTYGHNGRAVTNYILVNQAPGDAVIFYTFSEHLVFDYYFGRSAEAHAVSSSPAILFPLRIDTASIQNRTAPFRRVWLVLHQTRDTPFTSSQTKIIRDALALHFHQTQQSDFPGSGVDLGESGAVQIQLYVLTNE